MSEIAGNGWPTTEWDGAPHTCPLVLLPVRLETRYEPLVAPGPAYLRLRVYPDALHSEPATVTTTEAERTAGAAFWAQRAADRAKALDPAQSLVRQRAAFVALARACDGPWRALAVAEMTRVDSQAVIRPSTRATLLPRRWLVLGRDALGEVFRVHGAPIPETLQLHPNWERLADPTVPLDELTGLPIDDPARWLVDFDTAVTLGMALRIQLPPGREALKSLLVLGLRGGADDDDALAALLATHLRSDGLALGFPGDATNNTDDAPAAFDPDADAEGFAPLSELTGEALGSFVGDALLETRAGIALARVLGLATSTVPLLPRGAALAGPQAAAQHLAWSLAIEPYLRDVFDADDTWLTALGSWFERWVRPDGPVPLLRVGKQPYGVLPISARRSSSALEERLETFLHALRSHWSAALPLVPRVDPSADDDTTDPSAGIDRLVAVLQRHPNLTAFATRGLVIPHHGGVPPYIADVVRSITALQATTPGSISTAIRVKLADVLTAPGPFEQSFRAIALRLTLDTTPPGDAAQQTWVAKLKPALGLISELATRATASELLLRQAGLPAPYSGPLTLASPPALELGHDPDSSPWGTALTGSDLAWIPGLIAQLRAELDPPAPHFGQPLLQQWASLRGRELVTLCRLGAIGEAGRAIYRGRRDRLCAALELLAACAPAEVEALLHAALGTGVFRLDAWLTGIATARLARARALQAPTGLASRVGAFGCVFDLQRDPHPASAGHVLAPSLTHARMAALLRSGYAAHGDASGLAVDLRSARVRTARWVFDGVRQGQELGDLLGERFERNLHDSGQADLVPRFRRAVLDGLGQTDEPAYHIVDGLVLARALRPAWQLAEPPDAGEQAVAQAVQAALAPDLARAEPALLALDTVHDALADTSLADALHGLLEGDEARARATLEAVDRGQATPPTLEGLAMPRGGRAVHHRIAVLIPAPGQFGPGLCALTAPRLAAWLDPLFGPDPRFAFQASVGAAAPTLLVMTLAELGGGVLDLLALAPGGVLAGSALERLLQARAGDAGLRDAQIDPAPPGAGPALAELLAALAAAEDAITRAEPLTPQHLATRTTSAPALVEVTNPDDPGGRLTQLRARLDTIVALATRPAAPTAPELARARLLLTLLSPIPLALPLADAPDLRAWLAREGAAARVRLDTTPATAAGLRTLGPLRLPTPRVWTLPAAAASPWLWETVNSQRKWRRPAATGVDVMQWLSDLGATRPTSGALALALLTAECLGGPTMLARAFQAPNTAGWIGTSAPANLRADVTSLVLLGPAALSLGELAGLVIDEFSERIPAATADGGLAFHWDAPAARAPQTLLVVAPGEAAWAPAAVADLVLDTLQLARERLVGPEDLLRATASGPGRLLPALALPDGLVAPPIFSASQMFATLSEGIVPR